MTLNFIPTVRITRSVEKLTPVSLLNDFGSSMGLWLGISVFSMFEMVSSCALEIKVGEKWKIATIIIMVLGSLFVFGIGCLYFAIFRTYLSFLVDK